MKFRLIIITLIAVSLIGCTSRGVKSIHEKKYCHQNINGVEPINTYLIVKENFKIISTSRGMLYEEIDLPSGIYKPLYFSLNCKEIFYIAPTLIKYKGFLNDMDRVGGLIIDANNPSQIKSGLYYDHNNWPTRINTNSKVDFELIININKINHKS